MSPYLTFEQLNVFGRTTVSAEVPEQSRQSLPIPLIYAPNHVEVAFFFCPSWVKPREGALMTPPHFLVRLDPATGQRLELKAVTPGDFGRNDPPEAFLGSFRLPEGMTAQEYLERRSSLFALYDSLLPEFAKGAPFGPPQSRAAAREFMPLFESLREPPVAAYYDITGRRFLNWVRGTAEQRAY